MSASSLINISYGDRCEKSAGKGQQQQQQQQRGRSPYSPSLGASPELGKKHRSLDVRLESPGLCRRLLVCFILFYCCLLTYIPFVTSLLSYPVNSFGP